MTKEWDYDRLQEKLQLKENDCEQLREENLLLNEKKALFSNYENLADIEKEKNKILSDIQRNKEIFYSHKLNLEGEIDRETLQSKIGIKHRQHFRNAYLKPSLDEGYIEFTLPNEKQSKLQKYRLTAKGLALKESLKNSK